MFVICFAESEQIVLRLLREEYTVSLYTVIFTYSHQSAFRGGIQLYNVYILGHETLVATPNFHGIIGDGDSMAIATVQD